MSIFIKIHNDNTVTVAGTVATQAMLDNGYREYTGVIPTCTSYKWDKVTETLVADVDTQTLLELASIRQHRNQLLNASDWVVMRAYEAGEPVAAEWGDYRQQLRDITKQHTAGKEVTWPRSPDAPAEDLKEAP